MCLTPENLDARWILFKSWALSKRQGDKVCKVLLDVASTDVKPPLAQFQHTELVESDVFKLVQTINREVQVLNQKACRLEDLEDQFKNIGETS